MRQKLAKFCRAEWPLLLLSGLFIVQIYVFNYWTLGSAGSYLARLTIFNIGLAALFFGPSLFLHKKSHRYAYLLVVELLITGTFAAQYLFYAYSGSFLQASVIRYLGAAGDVSSSIKTLSTGPLAFFLCPLLVLLVLAFIDLHPRQPKSRRQMLMVVVTAVVFFGIGLGLVTIQDVRQWGNAEQIFNNPFDNGTLINKVGVIGYGALDLRKYLQTPRGISSDEKRYVAAWAAQHPAEKTSGKDFGIAKGKNLVFIQSESFERFLIGRTVGGQEITPNLNKFASGSLYFSHYYFVIGPGHTVDAEFTTLNSLLPLQDRVIFFEYPDHRYQTVATGLKSAGYSTNAFHGNVGSFWNRTAAYPALGYEHFYDAKSFHSNQSIGFGLPDEEFFAQSVDKLKQTRQPFFANLVTLTQHTPFDLPPKLKTLKIDKKLGLDWIQEAYLQSAHYYDFAFGQFINKMKAAGLYDKTVIALDGDHTAFIDKETDINFARFLGLKNGFDRTSFLENTQVPFIIHLPDGQLKGVVKTPASHLDIFPTLANLMGIRIPGSVLGHDALNTHQAEAINLRFNTKIVDGIETDKLLYVASAAGDFASGNCSDAQTHRKLRLSLCKPLYDDVQQKLEVSELVIRGNAIDLLNGR